MIQITANYAIDANMSCFTICKKGKRKGKTSWEPEFYFTSLEHVFQKLISLAVARGIEKGSWEHVWREVSETNKLIKEKMAVLTSLEIQPSTSGNECEQSICNFE